MNSLVRFICLISLCASITNCLNSIPDNDYWNEILDEDEDNMETFDREERSTLFPRVGRSYKNTARKLRRILTSIPTRSVDQPKRAIRIMRYRK
ncbi:unnamed protein product [Heterobilharzia americana]|nr:unnamed protein product [Heterobilharzia americana]